MGTLTASPPVRLNPSIDRQAARDSLVGVGRVQIPNLFPTAVAERLYASLSKEVPWNTIFSEGDEKVHTMHPTQVAAMTPEQRSWLSGFVAKNARDGYQFIYQNFPLYDLLQKGMATDLYAFEVARFVNSDDFLSFVRDISGVASIAMADCQATLFRPHHFLTRHTDRDHTYKGRRLAYVINMTPAWRAEWGGILEFLDESGNVAAGFTPCFNTLNIFHVPAWHHVSYVAPFAGTGRYSITGWLRDAE